jgi:hypothetical protein
MNKKRCLTKPIRNAGLKNKRKVGASIPPKLRFDVLGEIN